MGDGFAIVSSPRFRSIELLRNAVMVSRERGCASLIMRGVHEHHQVQVSELVHLQEQAPPERLLVIDRNIFWSGIVHLRCTNRHHTLSPTPLSVGL